MVYRPPEIVLDAIYRREHPIQVPLPFSMLAHVGGAFRSSLAGEGRGNDDAKWQSLSPRSADNSSAEASGTTEAIQSNRLVVFLHGFPPHVS